MNRKISKIALIFLMVLFLTTVAYAEVVRYNVTNQVKLAWDDAQTDIESYEVILIRDVTGVQYGPYTTTSKTITIPRPKSGVYEVQVRAVKSYIWPDVFTWPAYPVNPPPPESDGFIGYKFYLGESSRNYGPPVDVGQALEYHVTGLIPGRTYYTAIKVYNSAGEESPFSEEYVVTAVRYPLFSTWCSSIGDTAKLQTGVVGKWKVYFKVGGPAGPIVIY